MLNGIAVVLNIGLLLLYGVIFAALYQLERNGSWGISSLPASTIPAVGVAISTLTVVALLFK